MLLFVAKLEMFQFFFNWQPFRRTFLPGPVPHFDEVKYLDFEASVDVRRRSKRRSKRRFLQFDVFVVEESFRKVETENPEF